MIVCCDFDNMHCETQEIITQAEVTRLAQDSCLRDLQRQKQEEVLLKECVVLLPDPRLRPTGPDSGPGVKH